MGESKMRKQMIESFISALKEDIIPWERNWELTEAPRNAVSGNQYRGMNTLWLQYVSRENGYSDPRWCTFKQANEKGWRIKKGEKGTPIEFYSLYDKKQRRTISSQEAEQLRQEMEPEEYYNRVITVTKNSTVFNAEQINGIPAAEKKIARVSAEHLLKQRDVLLKNMDLKFEEGGDVASYSPGLDRIRMPLAEQFKNDYGYMATFLHEAAHATGHPKRLHRDLSNPKGSPGYAREELRAEIASALVAQEFNIITESQVKNHKAYIQSWIQVLEKNPNELFWAIKSAEQMADYLIEKGDLRSLALIEEPLMKEEIDKEPAADKEHVEEEIAQDVAVVENTIENDDVNAEQKPLLEILGLYEWEGKGDYVHYMKDGRQYMTNGEEIIEDVDFQVMYNLRRNVNILEKKEIDSMALMEKLAVFHPEISFSDNQLWQMDKNYDGLQTSDIPDNTENQEKELPLLSKQEAAMVHMALQGLETERSKWHDVMYTAYEVGEEARKLFQAMSMDNRENENIPWLIAERSETISVLINHKNSGRHSDGDGLSVLDVKQYISSLYANNREEYLQYMQTPVMSDYINVSEKMAAMILTENPDTALYQKPVSDVNSDYQLQEVKGIPRKSDKMSYIVNKEAFENRVNFYPTITCVWSESPAFEGSTIYAVSEFNALMRAADQEFCKKRNALIEKYGNEDSLYENASVGEARYMGYQKVKFTVDRKENFTVNGKQKNIITHKAERQDIGDGDGSVIDFLSLSWADQKAVNDLRMQEQKEQNMKDTLQQQTKPKHIFNRNVMKKGGR